MRTQFLFPILRLRDFKDNWKTTRIKTSEMAEAYPH